MSPCRFPTRKLRRHGVVLGTLAVLLAAPGYAADRCDLDEAEKRYRGGAFEQAMELVEACLERRPGREARVQALAIQAKIYLVHDDFDNARKTVDRLLAVDAGFQPARDDPPVFTELVRSGRRVEVASVSKSSEPLTEAPAVVTVYTRDDLDRLQPRNIAELLELTTGFLVERDVDDVGLGARGIVTDNNQKFLITIDGHRVSNNNNFGFNPFHKTRNLIAMAERIEIIRGPGGLLWGPDAFLGLVNVISRLPVTGEPANRLELAWGPGDGLLGVSFSRLDDLGAADVSIFADIFQADGEQIMVADPGGFDGPGTFWERIEAPSISLNGRVDWHGGWIAAQFLRFNHSVEGLLSNPGKAPQRDDFEQFYLELAQRRPIGDAHALSLRVYADRANAGRRDLEDGDEGFFFEFPENRFGAEVLFTSRISDNLSTIAGWDVRYYDYDGGELDLEISANGRSTSVGKLTTQGLFGQLSWHRGPFVLHLGGRLDTFSDDIDDFFVPRIALAYQPRENLGLKLLYTEGVLRPSWSQLAAFFTASEASELLAEESSRTVELQVLWNPTGYDSTLSLYRMHTEGTIIFLSGPQGDGYYNYADYSTIGIEWQNTLQIGHRLTAFWNVTFYPQVKRDELVINDAGGDNVFGFGNPAFVIPGTDRPYNIPDFFFAAGLTASRRLFGHPLDLTAIVRHKGKRRIQGIEGEAEDRELDTTYLDLKARYRIGRTELKVNGRNILDDDEIVGLATGEAGFIVPKGTTWELALAVQF